MSATTTSFLYTDQFYKLVSETSMCYNIYKINFRNNISMLRIISVIFYVLREEKEI